jgi:hypothetical protein
MLKKEDTLKPELKQSPSNHSLSSIYGDRRQRTQYSISQSHAFSGLLNENMKLNGVGTCYSPGTTIFQGGCKK